MTSLAERMRALIDERYEGNVAEAARDAKIGYTTLYQIVSGHTPNPSFDSLEKVARAWGVSVDYLVRGADTPTVLTLKQQESPAEEIIRVLDHPAGLRDVLGKRVSVSDVIKIAYSIAFEEELPPEEIAKLDRWRDHLLSTKSPAEHNAEHRPGA